MQTKVKSSDNLGELRKELTSILRKVSSELAIREADTIIEYFTNIPLSQIAIQLQQKIGHNLYKDAISVAQKRAQNDILYPIY